jgi:hypothetical protein
MITGRTIALVGVKSTKFMRTLLGRDFTPGTVYPVPLPTSTVSVTVVPDRDWTEYRMFANTAVFFVDGTRESQADVVRKLHELSVYRPGLRTLVCVDASEGRVQNLLPPLDSLMTLDLMSEDSGITLRRKLDNAI